MEGMIFAAGLGTRLRPLTDYCPKALVRLGGRPLLGHIIDKMQRAGIKRIVVNVHHFSSMVIDFLSTEGYLDRGVIVSDESDALLDTGGGLLKARALFTPGESVLIHNVDILSDLDLQSLINTHGENYVTLVVRNAEPGRGLRFSKEGILKGWENSLTGERKIVDDGYWGAELYSFCGIHIVSSDFLQNIKNKGCFSIIDEYLLQAVSHDVRSFCHTGLFKDLGTPAAIKEAESLWSKYFIL